MERQLERAWALCLLHKEEDDTDTAVLVLGTAAVDKRRSSMMGTRCRWDGPSLPREETMESGGV